MRSVGICLVLVGVFCCGSTHSIGQEKKTQTDSSFNSTKQDSSILVCDTMLLLIKQNFLSYAPSAYYAGCMEAQGKIDSALFYYDMAYLKLEQLRNINHKKKSFGTLLNLYFYSNVVTERLKSTKNYSSVENSAFIDTLALRCKKARVFSPDMFVSQIASAYLYYKIRWNPRKVRRFSKKAMIIDPYDVRSYYYLYKMSRTNKKRCHYKQMGIDLCGGEAEYLFREQKCKEVDELKIYNSRWKILTKHYEFKGIVPIKNK